MTDSGLSFRIPGSTPGARVTTATTKGKSVTMAELPPSLQKADSETSTNTHPINSMVGEEPQRK